MKSTTPARAVVLGACNLGGAITRDLLSRGAEVATMARTAADLEPLEATLTGFDQWVVAVARQTFVFLAALASQPAGAWTHQLVVTLAGGRWVP